MSRLVCTRVACLRLPWFQIDVLHRAGHLEPGKPVALVSGQGARARVTLVDPAARSLGLSLGMQPSKARALVSDLQVYTWEESADLALIEATDALKSALSALTPRTALIAPGLWWLEPASPRPDRESSLESLEIAFGERVLCTLDALGFPGARLGIADTPTCAAAATRDGGQPLIRIPPGEGRAYLGRLPVHALPLSARALNLLSDLGLDRVHHLQTMSAQELEARLGPEGRRAWVLSQGEDPRRPMSSPQDPSARITLDLLEGVREVAALLFVARPALETLISAQSERGHALAHLSVTLNYAWGAPHQFVITPSRPLSDAKLLMELLRLRLQETTHDEVKQGPIVALILEALKVSPQRAWQGDLFQERERTLALAEGTLVRLLGRLGKGAVKTPVLRDAHSPEASGDWLTPGEAKESERKPGTPALGPPLACLRLLPTPEALGDQDERPDRVYLLNRHLTPTHFHGPERISGQWWSAPYDRDYYWVSTEEGFALWLFRSRVEKRWFLHGWLD